MASTTSIRQRVIDNVVQTLDRSGIVREASDETPNVQDFTEKQAPHAWVFEGDEDVRLQTTNFATGHLTVVTQLTFTMRRKQDLHREGRAKLAEAQRLMMEDRRRGGWAFNTLESGNSISELEAENTQLVGVLTAVWLIQYDRNQTDPYSNS